MWFMILHLLSKMLQRLDPCWCIGNVICIWYGERVYNVVIVLNFPFYSPVVRGFCTSCYPFTLPAIRVGLITKSCKSFVMEADAPSSNMRGCESKSNELLCKLFWKCVDIMCILQCPFADHILLHQCLLFHIFHLRCCLWCLFTPVLIHTSKCIHTLFINDYCMLELHFWVAFFF